MTAKSLAVTATKLFKIWQGLEKAAKTEPRLAALVKQNYDLWLAAHNESEAWSLAEAERKDRRLPAERQVLWTMFKPDDILGMEIVTRTPNRTIRQRVPTFIDLAAAAFFPDGKDKDRFGPHARPAFPDAAYRDLEREWEPRSYGDPIAKMSKRVDHVMSEWGLRHEKARQREAAELARLEREGKEDAEWKARFGRKKA